MGVRLDARCAHLAVQFNCWAWGMALGISSYQSVPGEDIRSTDRVEKPPRVR